jgi:hypothetical protein
MTDDKDPALQTLFAEASQELDDEAFSVQVMEGVRKHKRRAVYYRFGAMLMVLVAVWLLSAPLQEAVGLLSQAVTRSLIDIDNQLLARLLSPVNSVAAALALGLLGTRSIYRKIFT